MPGCEMQRDASAEGEPDDVDRRRGPQRGEAIRQAVDGGRQSGPHLVSVCAESREVGCHDEPVLEYVDLGLSHPAGDVAAMQK